MESPCLTWSTSLRESEATSRLNKWISIDWMDLGLSPVGWSALLSIHTLLYSLRGSMPLTLQLIIPCSHSRGCGCNIGEDCDKGKYSSPASTDTWCFTFQCPGQIKTLLLVSTFVHIVILQCVLVPSRLTSRTKVSSCKSCKRLPQFEWDILRAICVR